MTNPLFHRSCELWKQENSKETKSGEISGSVVFGVHHEQGMFEHDTTVIILQQIGAFSSFYFRQSEQNIFSK